MFIARADGTEVVPTPSMRSDTVGDVSRSGTKYSLVPIRWVLPPSASAATPAARRTSNSVPAFSKILAAGLALSACGLPRDAAGTLDYIKGGTMRVGVVANPPWVIDRGESVDGVEGRLASEIARGIGARIEWVGSRNSI